MFDEKEIHYLEAISAVERVSALMNGANYLAGGCRYNDELTNKQRDAFVEAATWCVAHLTNVACDEFRLYVGKEKAPCVSACEA